jgi:hypothetical protein
MTDPAEHGDGEPADDHLTRIHTEIGNRPGLIVELRPVEREDEPPRPRDMHHLTRSDAVELHRALGRALGGSWLGEVKRLSVRGPGSDDGDPVLEIHGDSGMAAAEIPPEYTDGLTDAATQLDMARDAPDGGPLAGGRGP